jgi:outer membrane receptor protein involved in Fe transport
MSGRASADVFGRLQFSVKNAADEKPIAGAKITLKDSANVRPTVTLTTDAQGAATSGQLDVRAWDVTTEADTFQPDTRTVTVVADTTTPIEVLLEPLKENVIKITGERALVNKGQTQEQTRRDQTFVQKFPVTAANPQSLPDVLRSTPGFAADSVNQAHPRGEHSATAININGFYLPGALQGRAGQIIIPEIIQNLDIMTGAYAPEYGGETAAILNLSLRAGPIHPIHRLFGEGGNYATLDTSGVAGGQFGSPYGPPDANGDRARRFGYLIDVSGRRTNNALEPPQPEDQTAHNRGSSESYFGNFTYHPGLKDEISLIGNATPAFTGIANRTGLPAKYASVGQGFGYGGALSAVDAAAMGIPSQEQDGQDINQRDNNDFGVLQWRHNLSRSLFSLFSVGASWSGQNIRNGSPPINLQALPADSSIEFNPTVIRNYRHTQPQGSLTLSSGKHTYKAGLLDDEQSGNESYQLIPGSQIALDALFATDPRLAPAGTPQVDAMGNPVMDSNGNQVYKINPGVTTTPTLPVERKGWYRAVYLQDTWNMSRQLTMNYGWRGDWYDQSQNLGQKGVNTFHGSPRLNLAYAITPTTIGRVSYNHLFIEPPLAQGAILGTAIQPEHLDQYEGSVEHQFGARQRVKAAYFFKSLRNQIDTGLLIPTTQIGVFTSVNFQRGLIRGTELSYDYTPRNNIGWGAYANWTNQLNKPGGLDNTGAHVPQYNDHDQRNTINAGLNYTYPGGASVGADLYYGSGVASSPVYGDNLRNVRALVNMRISSGPRLFPGNHGGVELNVYNLFNRRDVINFNSGFSGTRFQQGLTVLLSAFGQF